MQRVAANSSLVPTSPLDAATTAAFLEAFGLGNIGARRQRTTLRAPLTCRYPLGEEGLLLRVVEVGWLLLLGVRACLLAVLVYCCCSCTVAAHALLLLAVHVYSTGTCLLYSSTAPTCCTRGHTLALEPSETSRRRRMDGMDGMVRQSQRGGRSSLRRVLPPLDHSSPRRYPLCSTVAPICPISIASTSPTRNPRVHWPLATHPLEHTRSSAAVPQVGGRSRSAPVTLTRAWPSNHSSTGPASRPARLAGGAVPANECPGEPSARCRLPQVSNIVPVVRNLIVE